MKNVHLPYATLTYEAPIVSIEFKENIELGFLEIRELIHHAEELSGHQPYLTLSQVKKNVRVTPVGKQMAADRNEAPLNCGSAVLVNSVLIELATNFFHSVVKVEFPFKAFTDAEKAKEWLLSLDIHKGSGSGC